jgi:hypothetical protein
LLIGEQSEEEASIMKTKNPTMGYVVALVHDFGGSPEACVFFETMTDQAFEAWKPRYQKILDGNGCTLNPPMKWWEKVFDASMKLGTCYPKTRQ